MFPPLGFISRAPPGVARFEMHQHEAMAGLVCSGVDRRFIKNAGVEDRKKVFVSTDCGRSHFLSRHIDVDAVFNQLIGENTLSVEPINFSWPVVSFGHLAAKGA